MVLGTGRGKGGVLNISRLFRYSTKCSTSSLTKISNTKERATFLPFKFCFATYLWGFPWWHLLIPKQTYYTSARNNLCHLSRARDAFRLSGHRGTVFFPLVSAICFQPVLAHGAAQYVALLYDYVRCKTVRCVRCDTVRYIHCKLPQYSCYLFLRSEFLIFTVPHSLGPRIDISPSVFLFTWF